MVGVDDIFPYYITARFTVKTLAPTSKVTLGLKATGTIDTAIPMSPVTVTASFKNFHAGNGETYDFRVLREKKGGETVDVTASFEDVWNGNVLTLTLKDTAEILQGYTYTLCMKYVYGNGLETPEARTKLSVKWSDPARVKATASAGVSGSIDVIRPATAIKVTPVIKNLYDYSLDDSSLVIGTMVNKKFTPLDDVPFDVTYEDGVFTVKAAEGASHTVKYYAKLTGIGGLENNKPIALPVKMGSAKFTANVKEAALLAKDRYSTANVKLSTADSKLSAIDRVELDAASLKFFKLTDLGGGTYAISYKDNFIPAGFRAGTAKTVKLNVFLDGNTTLKPNSTISVKVTIK